MQTLRLISIDDELARIVNDDPERFADCYHANLGNCASIIRDIVQQTMSLYGRTPRAQPWTGYLAAGALHFIVGACGFTGAPTANGVVEIAYFTFPEFEHRGYATAMAAALIEIAAKSTLALRAVAHTLPQPNASTRVLQKIGMTFAREIQHPEDGLIWLWEKNLRPVDKPQSLTC